MWDCLIVGAGPAGLTAATYLKRYLRSVAVLDAGSSRAALIPETHNHPAFLGISGAALLARMREQLQSYKVEVTSGTVNRLVKHEQHFLAETSDLTLSARRVLLCTGIKDVEPQLPGLEPAVQQRVVRYCPICDGFEAIGRRIAVYGPLSHALPKCLFLRTYSQDITLVRLAQKDSTELERTDLADIAITSAPATNFSRTEKGIRVTLADGIILDFDVLYPALGAHAQSQLASELGASCTDDNLLKVDDKQQTSISGLYAAGDIVSDLHQLCVAEGHAAVAATAIHNTLPPNFR